MSTPFRPQLPDPDRSYTLRAAMAASGWHPVTLTLPLWDPVTGTLAVPPWAAELAPQEPLDTFSDPARLAPVLHAIARAHWELGVVLEARRRLVRELLDLRRQQRQPAALFELVAVPLPVMRAAWASGPRTWFLYPERAWREIGWDLPVFGPVGRIEAVATGSARMFLDELRWTVSDALDAWVVMAHGFALPNPVDAEDRDGWEADPEPLPESPHLDGARLLAGAVGAWLPGDPEFGYVTRADLRRRVLDALDNGDAEVLDALLENPLDRPDACGENVAMSVLLERFRAGRWTWGWDASLGLSHHRQGRSFCHLAIDQVSTQREARPSFLALLAGYDFRPEEVEHRRDGTTALTVSVDGSALALDLSPEDLGFDEDLRWLVARNRALLVNVVHARFPDPLARLAAVGEALRPEWRAFSSGDEPHDDDEQDLSRRDVAALLLDAIPYGSAAAALAALHRAPAWVQSLAKARLAAEEADKAAELDEAHEPEESAEDDGAEDDAAEEGARDHHAEEDARDDHAEEDARDDAAEADAEDDAAEADAEPGPSSGEAPAPRTSRRLAGEGGLDLLSLIEAARERLRDDSTLLPAEREELQALLDGLL